MSCIHKYVLWIIFYCQTNNVNIEIVGNHVVDNFIIDKYFMIYINYNCEQLL